MDYSQENRCIVVIRKDRYVRIIERERESLNKLMSKIRG